MPLSKDMHILAHTFYFTKIDIYIQISATCLFFKLVTTSYFNKCIIYKMNL